MPLLLGLRKWKRLIVLLVIVVIVVEVASVFRFGPPVTISKETTFITEPISEDGFPDYVAALNKRCSRGVTLENNSAVLFWQTVGPEEIDRDYRDKFFEMLGIPTPPDDGDYFIPADKHEKKLRYAHRDEIYSDYLSYVSKEDSYGVQLIKITSCPWRRSEYPEWAEWIDANDKHLAILHEAIKRPRTYNPITGNSVTFAGLSGACDANCAYYGVAQALLARAMLRIGENKPEEAWSDILAIHRLARINGRAPLLYGVGHAFSIDRSACTGNLALLEYSKLSSDQIMKMRSELAALPPMSTFTDVIDVGHRISCLDMIVTTARYGFDGDLDDSVFEDNAERAKAHKSYKHRLFISSHNWDLMLRMVNNRTDRIIKNCRLPTRAEREKAFDLFDDEFETELKESRKWKNIIMSYLANPRDARSRAAVNLLLSINTYSDSTGYLKQDDYDMRRGLNDIAFALAAYRADNESYPDKLEQLAPKYIESIPKDIFNNNADLQYQRQDEGFILCSTGWRDNKIGSDNFYVWDEFVVCVPSEGREMKKEERVEEKVID